MVESDCVFQHGLFFLINNISWMRQSRFLLLFKTEKNVSKLRLQMLSTVVVLQMPITFYLSHHLVYIKLLISLSLHLKLMTWSHQNAMKNFVRSFLSLNILHTGLLDVLTSFFWFKSAFIREDLPTLVLPIKATCWVQEFVWD